MNNIPKKNIFKGKFDDVKTPKNLRLWKKYLVDAGKIVLLIFMCLYIICGIHNGEVYIFGRSIKSPVRIAKLVN